MKMMYQMKSLTPLVPEMMFSGLIVALMILIFYFGRKSIKKGQWSLDERRRKWIQLRNTVGLLGVGLLVMVWAGEIRSLFLSIAAITAALLIVSKEVISSFLGAVLFIITKPARIGDSIEIAGFRGELIDLKGVYFSIQEYHPQSTLYSGRILKLPTSLFLTQTVILLSWSEQYQPVTMPIYVRHVHFEQAHPLLMECALEVCEPFIEECQENKMKLEKNHWMDMPDPQPRIHVQSFDKDTVLMTLRFVCPFKTMSATQSKITTLFFNRLHHKVKNEESKEE